jgi:hypothetical protein
MSEYKAAVTLRQDLVRNDWGLGQLYGAVVIPLSDGWGTDRLDTHL